MPKTTASDILNAVNKLQHDVTNLCNNQDKTDEFKEMVTSYCEDSATRIEKLHNENSNLRRRVNGIGKLLKSLVDKFGAITTNSTSAISPPSGRERTRTTSNNSIVSLASTSSDDTTDQNNKTYTEMPCKPPARTDIWLTGLIDGWLLHGNTFPIRELIKAHKGQFLKCMKGWVFTDKGAVSRVVQRISVGVKVEKVKNTLNGIGYVPYKPDGGAASTSESEPKALREGHVSKENKSVLNFLDSSGGGDKSNDGRATTGCVIQDSDEETDENSGNVSDDNVDVSDDE
jgi:hypothetical protein